MPTNRGDVAPDDAPAGDGTAVTGPSDLASRVVNSAAQDIGEFIRSQREAAQVSLRQLSQLAGVSNPYLSQIERGLRKPSASGCPRRFSTCGPGSSSNARTAWYVTRC